MSDDDAATGDPAVTHGDDSGHEALPAQDVAAQQPAEREWWDDPRMPWKGKPRRVDIACWASFCVIGIYGLVTLPLRPILLSLNTYVLAAVSGSSIAMVDFGTQLRAGTSHFGWFGLLLGALSVMKFDWIFWWAGRLWGHGIIEVVAGRSRWAARTAHHAERLADRFGAPAVVLAWFIPFIPTAIVDAFVGNARMKLRNFLLLDFAAAVVNRGIYFYLGYRIGAPAKHLVDLISKYSYYISIVLVVGIIASSIIRSRRQRA
ncbi:DedA family protein [Leekyejoonella antrihumi]|uniref:DedA family protein n=1 Tax=Leekyejoonella antrihumi TaxID=1660198 RepID=A0A563DWU6_9MICO|nr:VTT domain-containing protein [Leekyejoonella antrihumi]TWP34403.1 DedA family protein [Leekyejoonella antrihumi]